MPFKKIVILLALFFSAFERNVSAKTILIQWGELGGDTNIVAETHAMDSNGTWTGYIPGRTASPEQGATYYPLSSDRSPAFNNARSHSYGTRNITDASDGDAIQFGKNSAYDAMVVWEELLVTGAALSQLSVEMRSFGSPDAVTFRWLIQTDNSWFASGSTAITDTYQTFTVTDPASLTWNTFTPRNTIGAVASVSLDSVTAIGYYFETTFTDGGQSGAEVRYFSAINKKPTSIETGYTIQKVRTAMVNSNELIIASTYEGAVLGIDYAGTTLWTNSLSGYMNHDLWCDDVTGNGNDEILVANADGSVYCLDADGVLLWEFQPNDGGHLPPMYAVCTVHDTNDIPYVVCGAYDKYIYYIDGTGALEKSIYSHTYSVSNPWGDDQPEERMHNANFLRPVPQSDGTEHLAVLGTCNHMQTRGSIYQFKPLADLPFQTNTISKTDSPDLIGDFRVTDPDGDGEYEILLGTSSLGDQGASRFNPVSGEFQPFALTSVGDSGYRVTQVETVPEGDSFQYMMLCGNYMVFRSSLDTNVTASVEKIHGTYAYNDIWKDASGRILLASAQSGGSCVHVLDPQNSDWKADFSALAPRGKIATIIKNTEQVWTNLESFIKPSWERDPIEVILTQANPKHAVALNIQANHASPVFLNYYWDNYAQSPTDWDRATVLAENPTYRDKRDGRRSYTLTESEILTKVGAENDGGTGLAMWGGHGNDPYYYSMETLKGIIDLQAGEKTVLIWPEMNGSSDEFEMVMNDRFYPLAEYARTNNANIYVRNKNIFWQSSVYLPAWSGVLNGDYSDVFVSGLEETTDKTQDLSILGRMGVWASGGMDNWGMRCSRDNPSFDRQRQHSYQRLPNHFLRTMVYSLASGASYLNVTYVDEDYQCLAWELVATGALFVPKRNEIVSFNPVHLSITDPDEHYIEDGENNKWTTFYDQSFEQENPFVFSHMNGTWPAAPVNKWDFSHYANGVNDRRQNFIPAYPHGQVLITPPQEGAYADTTAYRSPMTNYMHPMYKNILQEFITDGRHYYSPDGSTTYAADSYYTTVANAITNSSALLPLTVSGDVAWVCAQTDDRHLRLTLVDSGYLNPKARTATVTFHSVTPMTVSDVLTGEIIATSGDTADIGVPLGLFRFIDIELSEDFYAQTQSDWTDYKYLHGLSGDAAADYDNDGESDLYEYALGGHPKDSMVIGTDPTLRLNTDGTVSYTNWERSSAESGISYTAQWTDDLLSNWNTDWGSLTYSSSLTDYVEAERTLDAADSTNLFFRLEISQP